MTNSRPWHSISSAPRNREIELRSTYIPSEEAARNGAKQIEQYGTGRWIYGDVFSGMQGHSPHSWREIKGELA